MARTPAEQPPNVDFLEERLLQIARFGLVGDTRSLRQQLRNLQRSGNAAHLSPPARARLSGMMADTDAAAPMRAAARATAATDGLMPGVAGIPEPVYDADEPVLDPGLRESVSRLVREHERRHLLEEANLAPTSRILLTGPPGSGKTMTARWLAFALGLPMTVVEPSAVLSSLLGESAKALAAAFRAADRQPCVLFLDELDVFARRRSDTFDIAEPKRLVNTLLLELDRLSDRTIVIGATNHLEALDAAVVRRFQLQLGFGAPSDSARADIMRGVLDRAGRALTDTTVRVIAAAAAGRSASEVVDTTVAALRRSIIDEVDLETAVVNQFVGARYTGRGEVANRARLKVVASLAELQLTHERIAELVGTKPPTVLAMLQAAHNARA